MIHTEIVIINVPVIISFIHSLELLILRTFKKKKKWWVFPLKMYKIQSKKE